MASQKQVVTTAAEHLASRSSFTFKTDSLAARCKPRDGRYLVFDKARRGFGVRVSPDATCRFVLRYKLEGKQRTTQLDLPTFTAATINAKAFEVAVAAWQKASDEVKAVRRKRRAGEEVADPMEARRRARATLLQVERSAIACEDAVTAFLRARREQAERRAQGKASSGAGLREGTAKAYERTLRADFLTSTLAKGRKLRDLTQPDVIAILEEVNKRGAAAADQTAGAIKSFCTWAVAARMIESSPARDLPTYYVPKPRDRVLAEKEIAALLPLLDGDAMKSGRTPKLALLLSLATGQRTGELLALTWSDVDAAARVLTIPARIMKAGKAHRVPLSPLALEIVGELRVLAGESQWMFPGDDPADHLKQQTLGVAIRRNTKLLQRHGIKAFAPHDMRRTCRTHLSALGVPEMVAELVLAHALPGKVQAAYAHYSHEEAMRDALDKWSGRLCDLRGRPVESPTVVPFPSAAVTAA